MLFVKRQTTKKEPETAPFLQNKERFKRKVLVTAAGVQQWQLKNILIRVLSFTPKTAHGDIRREEERVYLPNYMPVG